MFKEHSVSKCRQRINPVTKARWKKKTRWKAYREKRDEVEAKEDVDVVEEAGNANRQRRPGVIG